MAKLFVSEAAGRCADRAVQAFGGRGYLRSQRRRALQPRAARGPDLGGHQRGPAADHLPRARAPRGRGDDPLTIASTGLQPRAAPAPGVGRGRRRHRPRRQLRRAGADQPRGDRLPGRGVGGQPGPHRGARPAVRAVARRPARAGRRRRRGDPRRRASPDVIEQAGARGLRRRRRVQRRVRRGGSRAPALQARAGGGGAAATRCRCAAPTATGSSRRTRATALWGDALAAARAGRGGADLAERQRGGQRAGHPPRTALSHRDRQRQPGGPRRRRLPRAAGRRGRPALGRAVPGGRRRPAAVRRAGGVRARPACEWSC